MAPTGPDASNAALPASSPVVISVPPVPTATRGERVNLDGRAGRYNNGKAVVAYTSGRSIVIRNLLLDKTTAAASASLLGPDPTAKKSTVKTAVELPVLVYRGHLYKTTACKLAPSGCYVATGDERGMIRVWALDHADHLCKYDAPGLTGPIRDLDWDAESKKICIGGERSGDARSADCTRIIQWDTGVSVGQLSNYLKGRCSAVAVKPDRPFRIATAGKDEPKCQFHQGPPFARIPPDQGVPEENAHTKSGVNCIRYNKKGTLLVSVGADRSIVLYDGKTMAFKSRLDNVHTASIYSVAWKDDDSQILTAGGDGICKLFDVAADGSKLTEVKQWNAAEHQLGKKLDSKPPVGGIQLGCTFVNGSQPISVGLNGQICILKDNGSIDIITGHYAPVQSFAVCHDKDVFYTADSDGIMCQWKLSTCECIRRLEHGEGNDDLQYVVHGGAVSGLACDKTGNLLSVGWDDKLYETKAGQNKASLSPTTLAAQPSAIATGSTVAVIITVQGLLVYKNGSLGSMVSIPYDAHSVCVTKDDKTVYVGGSDCKIHVYDCDGSSLKEKHVIDSAHLKPVHAVALSNDESKLASADVRDVCVWDLKKNYESIIGKGRWCFHVQRITVLAWSADDQVLASGGVDDSIYLWNIAEKNKRIQYPYAHRGGLSGLTFLKNDKHKLVSVGMDSVVNMWDVSADVKEKFGL